MKVLVINKFLKDRHREQIRRTAESVNAEVFFADTRDDVPQDKEDAEVIYGHGMKFAAKSMDLKWLCVPSAGVDFLLKPGMIANPDCLVTNSAGSYGVTIAEHIIAVTLVMMRNLGDNHDDALKKTWGPQRLQDTIYGKRIVVLGTGDIGCSFAKRARSFEPESLTGLSRSGRCREDIFDKMYAIDALDDILPSADLLVMCLPGTDETKGILSRERIGMLPQGAYVVNVGRGSAIDEDALADALDEGRLKGAALDVFNEEPLGEDSRLWTTRNLLITPHVAGCFTTEVTMDKNVDMFCEDLVRYARGKPLLHLIDKEKGY